MQHGALQSAFTDVVIQRSTRLAQECGQTFPVPEEVRDSLAQAGVGLYKMLRELRLHPFLECLQERLAMQLMKLQTLFGRQLGGAGVRILFIYAAQRFQNVTAGFRKTSRDFHELAAAMSQTVGQKDLRTII